jgi:type IV pilus assembly protein PilB
MDLGVDPFNIGSSLNAIVAQRLVRQICKKCKQPDAVGEDLRQRLPSAFRNREIAEFWKGGGCDACSFTGYSGRIGINEVLRVTPGIQKLIRRNSPVHEIEEEAHARGFQTLSVDGIGKATRGLTSISEIFRVAPPAVEDLIEGSRIIAPMADDTEAEDLPVDEHHVPVASIAPRRILVVEDNEFMLRLIQGILEGEGYVTITAQNGTEALKIGLTEIPDLIVTDYLMPEMDGITLIKKLRSKMATSYIPIIILTIKDEVDLEVEGINAGADDFLVKPINARKFISRVNRLLRKRFDQ